MPAEIKKKASPFSLLARHWEAFQYVFGTLLPIIIKTGRRPVIFSRWTGMGDIICTIPAALELGKRHPGVTFIYNCHPDFTTIPKVTGVAKRITSLQPIGLVGHWYGWLTGGFYHFAHGDDLADSGCKETMVTEFLRQFNLPISEEHPLLTAPAEAQASVRAKLERKGMDTGNLIVIHPGPTWPVREWPRENWTELVAALRARGFKNIAQLGVGRYLNFGKVTVEPIPGAVSLVDEFSVEECIALIGKAKLFIGIDSGLLHIAAGVRVPAVGIFGMTLPEYRFSESYRADFVTNRVECAGCEHRKPRLHWVTGCPYDIRCMKTLPSQAVIDNCLKKLGQ